MRLKFYTLDVFTTTRFGGNPLAMAVANAVLDLALDEKFLPHVQMLGLKLRQKLAMLADRYPRIVEGVRGEGLMLGLQCRVTNTDLVAALREEGRAVFVNFTAAWCVTCKVNEATSLATPQVAEAFADANVAYLVGDWTNRDEAIAAALAEHGRAGVPLYVYYPPEGNAVVLPQILSRELVIETVMGERE